MRSMAPVLRSQPPEIRNSESMAIPLETSRSPQLSIYAFSDPNDILSYPIPPKFADAYLDSRLCPKVTNIAINVAKPISLFGLGEFANPAAAHGDYEHDERVIALIAHGIGQENTADIVKERCTWLQTIGD